MQRLRLYDVRMSRLPGLVGLCASDTPAISAMVNTAQRRLIYAKEGTDEGWWGTWAEIVFNVSRSQPYITLPAEIARLEALDVCDAPMRLNNQFYEYLNFGNGRMPKTSRWAQCNNNCVRQAYTRNNAVTFIEMTNAPQYIVAYPTDALDMGKRTMIQGADADGNTIYTIDVSSNVQGQFLTFAPPTASMTPQTFSALTGIQKDLTIGAVRYYQHDPVTGEETLLLTMQPGELTASYRRYYLNGLPRNCCNGVQDGTDLVQVTALAKLELLPVRYDTDYLLIQNLEAIIEECQSVRYSEMDSATAKQMAAERHHQAVGYLNGELNHYLGKNQIAINFAPFGRSRLQHQKIGSMQ